MGRKFYFLLVISIPAVLSSCKKDEEAVRTKDEFYLPLLYPANFADSINNPYLPLTPGKKYVYQGSEVNEVTVSNSTKTILGINCVVVYDTVKVNGSVTEATIDWYAQDNDGNVWYMGEDSKEIDNGAVVSTEGSWEAGVDGAQPGIVMPATPLLGVPYRQEYYFDEAEDMGKVIETNATVTVPYGTFTNCIVTEEWTPLEEGFREKKYYAPGTGNIKSEVVEGGSDVTELANIL